MLVLVSSPSTSLIVAITVTFSLVVASVMLIAADSNMGAVFCISKLEDSVHDDHSVPSFTRTSTVHMSPLAVIAESSVDVEMEVMIPFFNQRYCVSTIESMSSSEEIDDATSVSSVPGFVGETVILSTTGALFEVSPVTKMGFERTQGECPSPS